MKCPTCSGKTRCIDTRDSPEGYRRRRYICIECTGRFSTAEIASPVGDHRIGGPRSLLRSVRLDVNKDQMCTVAIKLRQLAAELELINAPLERAAPMPSAVDSPSETAK